VCVFVCVSDCRPHFSPGCDLIYILISLLSVCLLPPGTVREHLEERKRNRNHYRALQFLNPSVEGPDLDPYCTKTGNGPWLTGQPGRSGGTADKEVLSVLEWGATLGRGTSSVPSHLRPHFTEHLLSIKTHLKKLRGLCSGQQHS
jgi:hypothetical protein